MDRFYWLTTYLGVDFRRAETFTSFRSVTRGINLSSYLWPALPICLGRYTKYTLPSYQYGSSGTLTNGQVRNTDLRVRQQWTQ